MLLIKDVHFLRHKDFCLEVERVELSTPGVTLLIGPNGSGKTSLLSLLSGSSHCSGTILWDDTKPDLSLMTWRRRLGWLGFPRPIYKELSVKEYLEFCLRIRHGSERNLDSLVERFGVDVYYNQKMGALSEGMAQRVVLIQSFLHNPQYVLLDEPFNALDREGFDILWSYLKEISAGTSVFFAGHLLSDIPDMALNILLLKSGKVLFSGSKKDFLSQEKSYCCIVTVSHWKAQYQRLLQEKNKNITVEQVIHHGHDQRDLVTLSIPHHFVLSEVKALLASYDSSFDCWSRDWSVAEIYQKMIEDQP